MSLKAKIEAVIYASEDPVTLVQLTGLLGEEAQAELDLLDAAQQRLTLELVPPPIETPAEEFETAAALDESATLPADDTRSEEDAPNQDALNAEIPDVDLAVTAAVAEDPGAVAEIEAEPAPETEPEEVVLLDAPEVEPSAREEKDKAKRLRGYFRSVLDELVREYQTSDRGLEIREVAGGFRFATKPEYHDAVRGFVKSLKPPLKLSLQALETLAVVAYKQPVTAPEISEIRGVDSGGVLVSLLGRKLIATAGRKHVIGRPILYKTTKEFLLRFGLKDIAELPSIEEFEKLAGQMAEQEEIPMGDAEREIPEANEEQLESDGVDEAVEPVADEVIVDGRESGLPPDYASDPDDPSATEAEIQSSGS